MQKHSARLKNQGFHELEIIETKLGQKRRNGLPKVSEFVLDYPDKAKRLTLRPTKGYKLERI